MITEAHPLLLAVVNITVNIVSITSMPFCVLINFQGKLAESQKKGMDVDVEVISNGLLALQGLCFKIEFQGQRSSSKAFVDLTESKIC